MAPKYNSYVLGGNVELDLTVYDRNNTAFIPNEARMSIKDPDGGIITISGGLSNLSGDLLQASGYLYNLYRPFVIGWYEYETWAKDGTGKESTGTNGFEVIDRVY